MAGCAGPDTRRLKPGRKRIADFHPERGISSRILKTNQVFQLLFGFDTMRIVYAIGKTSFIIRIVTADDFFAKNISETIAIVIGEEVEHTGRKITCHGAAFHRYRRVLPAQGVPRFLCRREPPGVAGGRHLYNVCFPGQKLRLAFPWAIA